MSADSSRIIVANWKMNGTHTEASHLITSIATHVADDIPDTDVIICPPFTLLSHAKELIDNTPIQLGGQDCHHKSSGAFTGDISADMLHHSGCSHVIVGHSERRQYHKETNHQVRLKAEAALAANLTPVICVGETHDERTSGMEISIITEQVLNSTPEDHDNIIIAYEPVWAIGTGNIPTAKQIQEIHHAIKDVISAPVLYGGSVKPANSAEILATPHVDGLLVGGASLNAQDFISIINS